MRSKAAEPGPGQGPTDHSSTVCVRAPVRLESAWAGDQ